MSPRLIGRTGRRWPRATLMAGSLAMLAGCSHEPAPTAPTLKVAEATPLSAAPARLVLALPAPSATVRAMVQYVGDMTAVSSNPSCATVSPGNVPATKPQGSPVYVATFTVTGVATGTCTITITDKKGQQVQVQVVVKPFRETLEAGGFHSCGLGHDGNTYCWGENGFGQLGDGGASGNSVTPVTVSGGLTFTTLSTGRDHTCALTVAGTAYCWGYNKDGQLGDGATNAFEVAPLPVSTTESFARITGGVSHSCGLTTGGQALCWGSNSQGELGSGSSAVQSDIPTAVTGPDGGPALSFAILHAGGSHTCGLTTGGRAYCWGNGRRTPAAVSGPGGGAPLEFLSLAVGGSHACALTSTGRAWCWGANGKGQLGDGSTTDRVTPTAVAAYSGTIPSFANLNAGDLHTCGTTLDGTTLCWGANGDGQLGDGTTSDRTAPSAVLGDYGRITAGELHTCAFRAGDRTGYCWGANFSGQLGDGTTTARTVPTAIAGPGGGTPLMFQP